MATNVNAVEAAAAPEPVAETPATLDFDMPEIKAEAPAAEAGGLDFDLGFDTPAASAPAAAAEPAPAADLVLDVGDVDANALEFDVKLTESTVLGGPMTSEAPSFDMTSINLDLAEPKASAPAPEPSFESATVVDSNLAASLEASERVEVGEGSEEVATKLDLAKAYEEMGDLEGARELLQEVVKEGNADQQAAAQAILARVGA